MVHESSEAPREREASFEEQLVEALLQPAKPNDTPWSVPKTPDELHERVCKAAEAIGADVEILYRETAAAPLELARWLRYAESQGTLLAIMGQHVQRNYDPAKDTYKCQRCLDRGRVQRAPRGGYETVQFCTCETGCSQETGWWFNYLYPADERGRRALNQARLPMLERYCRKYSRTKSDLTERITQLKDGYEKRQKRSRLDSLEEEL